MSCRAGTLPGPTRRFRRRALLRRRLQSRAWQKPGHPGTTAPPNLTLPSLSASAHHHRLVRVASSYCPCYIASPGADSSTDGLKYCKERLDVDSREHWLIEACPTASALRPIEFDVFSLRSHTLRSVTLGNARESEPALDGDNDCVGTRTLGGRRVAGQPNDQHPIH